MALLVDGTPEELWEDCAMPGCPHKRCASLSPSPYCWPHSNDPVSLEVKRLEALAEELTKAPAHAR